MADNLKISAVAGQDIPPGTRSSPMTTSDAVNVNNVFWSDNDLDYIIEVSSLVILSTDNVGSSRPQH